MGSCRDSPTPSRFRGHGRPFFSCRGKFPCVSEFLHRPGARSGNSGQEAMDSILGEKTDRNSMGAQVPSWPNWGPQHGPCSSGCQEQGLTDKARQVDLPPSLWIIGKFSLHLYLDTPSQLCSLLLLRQHREEALVSGQPWSVSPLTSYEEKKLLNLTFLNYKWR